MRKEISTQMKSMGTDRTGTAERSRSYDIAYIGIFAVVIAICSWISIPTTVPFSLQTFAIFLSVILLGGKRGTMSVLVYILLGAVGVPVFAEFTGGIGIILNTTGGYILGFLLTALIMWAAESMFGRKRLVQIISMLLGMAAYYAAGTAWFMFVYTRDVGAVGLMTVLGWCVFPFIIPDLIKLIMALTLGNTLRKSLAGLLE